MARPAQKGYSPKGRGSGDLKTGTQAKLYSKKAEGQPKIGKTTKAEIRVGAAGRPTVKRPMGARGTFKTKDTTRSVKNTTYTPGRELKG